MGFRLLRLLGNPLTPYTFNPLPMYGQYGAFVSSNARMSNPSYYVNIDQ